MSNSDSFIDEVSEEVRRDRLYRFARRYGWIAVLLILAIVGGAAWNEWRKAQARTAAENRGDAIFAAMEAEDISARITALEALLPQSGVGAGQPALDFIIASQQIESDQDAAAVETLDRIALNSDTPEIYRQIAVFKALNLASDTMSPEERRQQYQALAEPGAPLRLLAEEQLALLDISEDKPEAAIARLQRVLEDAEVTPGLQQRARQVIVALGGEPVSASAPMGELDQDG